MALRKIFACLTLGCALLVPAGLAAAPAVPEKEWAELSDRQLSGRGRAALETPGPWKHAESEHFIYHYTDARTAAAVTEGAEFTYEWVRRTLNVGTDEGTPGKPHLFVFEDEAVWRAFAARSAPGENADAFTDGAELFVWRNPAWLEPKKTLAHEITHAVVTRFLGGPVPLFLHEGLAEFVSYRALARQLGVSEYDFRYVAPVGPDEWIDLDELTAMTGYPSGRTPVFYRQSEWVVRFLVLRHEPGLLYRLLREVSGGAPFKRALREVYGYEWEDFRERVAGYARAPERRRSG